VNITEYVELAQFIKLERDCCPCRY